MIKKIKLSKAYGVALINHGKNDMIIVESGLPAKRMLNTAIHESLHLLFPNKKEKKIKNAADAIEDLLWRLKFRRISS